MTRSRLPIASSRSRPTIQGFASLNLGQAVLLLGYEWFKAGDQTPSERIDHGGQLPATREELVLLFEHLEDELEKGGFLFPPGNRPGMIRNLRSILHRAQLTDQEVRTLRGVIVSLTKGKKRGNPARVAGPNRAFDRKRPIAIVRRLWRGTLPGPSFMDAA